MPYSHELDIRMTDSSLRDGSHAKGHQFTEDMVRSVVAGLDSAGMPVIEVTHGDGLGGSSFNYGFSLDDERILIAAAVEEAKQAKIAALMLPGLGTKDDITAVGRPRRVGHPHRHPLHRGRHLDPALRSGPRDRPRDRRVPDDGPLAAARGARRAGADHGRRRVPMRVRRRLGRGDDPRRRRRRGSRRVVAELGSDAQVGFHGHENLALGVANSIYAIRAGATQIDGSTRRFGAGAGNTPCEALAAVCDKLGIRTGIDVLRLFDVAEEIVRPVMDGECALDRLSLIMGYAGVYSSFLRHAYRAAERYGVSGADILLECGERRLVGGQEDEIIDIAVGLANAAR